MRNVSHQHTFVSYRDYSKFDPDKLRDVLTWKDWEEIVNLDDLDISLYCFNATIVGIMDLVVPVKRKRVKHQAIHPWSLSEEVRLARKLRDRAHQAALKSGLHDDWLDYRRLRNKATSVLRRCKSQYFCTLAKDMKESQSRFWRSFNHLSSQRKSTSVCQYDFSPNEFNFFFLDAPLSIRNQISASTSHLTDTLTLTKDVNAFHFQDITNDEVSRLLSDFDSNKATGHDGIPMRFVKLCGSFLAHPLRVLINRSLSSSIVPSEWKKAIVIPLLKSKENRQLNNYRPISVLPALSKLLERVVYHQLMCHLTNERLLSPIKVTDDWRKVLMMEGWLVPFFWT